jgi:hypothetical protein
MVQLTPSYIKEKLDYINSKEVQRQKAIEYQKYLIYNGQLVPIIEAAIRKEFSKEDTINELMHRLLPLNIMRKIIAKTAQVYLEPAQRSVLDGNEGDLELLESYEDMALVNIKMKEANKYFKLFKKSLVELYVCELGYPKLRVLPPHTYYTFSSSSVSPEIPDNVWKVLESNIDPSKTKYAIYTDTQFVIIDGNGNILRTEMLKLQNEQGINPFGTMPFAYVVDSSISTEPIPEDALLRFSIVIPILLTDLAFAIKYLSWAIIYTSGVEQTNVTISPNSIVHLPPSSDGTPPKIDMLRPDVNIDGVLNYIKAAISYLLSSMNLKTNSLSGEMTADNAASGIAKAIDNAEIAEDKKEQQAYFLSLENQIWLKFAKFLVPYWRQAGMLSPDINREFSPNFRPVIKLQDPKVMLSERELIELAKFKIDNGFSTLRRELLNLYPDYGMEDVEALLKEIEEARQIIIEQPAEEEINASNNQE